jgi:glycosyltransferase involved in cell wall biosynthesis
MKILFISHIFPPAIDGGSRVIYKLGQYFQSQNHQVRHLSSNCFSTDDFVNPKSKKTTKSHHNFIKLPVYKRLRRPLKFINLFFSPKLYFHQLLNVYQKGPIFRLVPFLKATFKIIKFQPDLIITGPLPTTTVLYANFFKKLTKSKLLINPSFHPNDSDFRQQPLIRTLQQSDFIWSLTQFEAQYFIKKFNINPQKIILAGNGVDPKILSKKLKINKTNNLLFIGSLSAHKGVDLLLEAFSGLATQKKYKDLTLTIAGQKTLYYPQLEKMINSLDKNIKSKVKVIFNFPQSKLFKLIDKSTCLILPSNHESFGLVLIESWGRSKPVITSNIPSLQELVNKSNGGLTFQKNNSNDLKVKIKEIIDNPNLNKQLAQNGYQYVKTNYTWPKIGKKIWQKIS